MIGTNGGLDLLVPITRGVPILISDPNCSMDNRIRTIPPDSVINDIEDPTLDGKSDRLDA